MNGETLVYKRPETLIKDKGFTFCPGCGHGVVLKIIAELIDEFGIIEFVFRLVVDVLHISGVFRTRRPQPRIGVIPFHLVEESIHGQTLGNEIPLFFGLVESRRAVVRIPPVILREFLVLRVVAAALFEVVLEEEIGLVPRRLIGLREGIFVIGILRRRFEGVIAVLIRREPSR